MHQCIKCKMQLYNEEKICPFCGQTQVPKIVESYFNSRNDLFEEYRGNSNSKSYNLISLRSGK